MKLTNEQIYTYASGLIEAFNDVNQRLPIKINFYLQKNKNLLIELAQDIEKTRLEIAQHYGVLDEENDRYDIKPEDTEIVAKEINDLLSIEQDVNIYTINIDKIEEDLMLTTAQMEALMFMINE